MPLPASERSRRECSPSPSQSSFGGRETCLLTVPHHPLRQIPRRATWSVCIWRVTRPAPPDNNLTTSVSPTQPTLVTASHRNGAREADTGRPLRDLSIAASRSPPSVSFRSTGAQSAQQPPQYPTRPFPISPPAPARPGRSRGVRASSGCHGAAAVVRAQQRLSGRAAVGVAREHGGLAHVVEVEVEEHEPLEADAAAAVWRHAVAHRVDVAATASRAVVEWASGSGRGG